MEIKTILENLATSDEAVLSTLKALYKQHFVLDQAETSAAGVEQFPLAPMSEGGVLESLRTESETAFAQLVTLASKNPSNKNYYFLLTQLLNLENAISKKMARAPLPVSNAATAQDINTYSASQQSLLLQLYVLLSKGDSENKNQISNVILKEFAPVKNYFLLKLLVVMVGLAALAAAIGFAILSFRRGVAANDEQDASYNAANQKMADYCVQQNNGTHAGQWLPDTGLNACHYTEDEDDQAWILEQCCLGIKACIDALPALIQEFNDMCDSRYSPAGIVVGVVLVFVALIITCCFGVAISVKMEDCGKAVRLPFKTPAYNKIASLVGKRIETFPENTQELLRLIVDSLKNKDIDPAVTEGLLRDLKAKLRGSADNITSDSVAISIDKETTQLLPNGPARKPFYGIQ